MKKELTLTTYKPQGLGHIAKLGGMVTAGTVLVSVGGSLLFAAPLALAAIYGMFRSSHTIKSANWCESRDEIFTYRISPKHPCIADNYEEWCKDWGTKYINSLIEPMIGECEYADILKDKNHPYHGLRGVLVFVHEEDDIPLLCPYDYIKERLRQREAILGNAKELTIDVAARNETNQNHRHNWEANELLPRICSDLQDDVQEIRTIGVGPVANDLPAPPVAVLPPLGGKYGLEMLDIAAMMASKLKPTIITAKPRVGKGIVVSHAWRHAKKLNPDLTVWVIQPKPHQTELGYWEGCDRFWGKMIENYPIDDEQNAAELESFILEWRGQANRPTLLIIDELVKLEAQMPRWYKRFIPALMKVESSSGETDRRFLWAITQSPLVSDLGLSGGNRSAFEMLAIERADSLDHAESVRSSIASIKTIPHSSHFESSPVGVLAFHNAIGTWKAVPRYEVPQPKKIIPSNVVEMKPAKKQNNDAEDDIAYVASKGSRKEFLKLINASSGGGSFHERWTKARDRAEKLSGIESEIVMPVQY
jgi:hypothetical protein